MSNEDAKNGGLDEETCSFHPEREAHRFCDDCERYLCEQCVEERKYHDDYDIREKSYFLCKKCKGRAGKIFVPEEEREVISIPELVADSFGYPLQVKGLYVIFGGIVFILALELLLYIARYNLPILGAIGTGLFSLVGTGYLTRYFLDVIHSSAMGEEKIPDWPAVMDFWTTLIKPIVSVTGTALFSFLPYVLLHIFPFEPRLLWWILVALSEFFGGLYFPMALLAVIVLKSAAGLLPNLVLRSIAKARYHYFAATICIFINLFVLSWIQEIRKLLPWIGIVPVSLVFLYLSLVMARMLGLIFDSFEKRLNWFTR